eukprot:m.137023 g.137023  ORF g.137023 m.137023 type:complete len:139 (+) comp15883_c3_seq1:1033-1449(+)
MPKHVGWAGNEIRSTLFASTGIARRPETTNTPLLQNGMASVHATFTEIFVWAHTMNICADSNGICVVRTLSICAIDGIDSHVLLAQQQQQQAEEAAPKWCFAFPPCHHADVSFKLAFNHRMKASEGAVKILPSRLTEK